MSKATSLAKLVATACALMLPVLASAAEDRSCWLRDAASPAPNIIYALCQQGKVYASLDSGASWAGRDTGSDQDLRAIAFSDATHGLVVGDKGAMYGTDDAKKWDKRDPGTPQNLLTIFMIGTEAWTGGFGGVILHSSDYGKTWEKQPTGTTQAIEDIFFYDVQHGWAVGWAGTIMRTSDGGKKWEPIATKAANWSLTAVRFKDLKNGWIAGFAGQLLRTEDGGATWAAQPAPFKGWLTSVAYDQTGRTWVTADDQFLLSEDGTKFRSMRTDSLLYMRQLVPVGKELWAVGQLGLLRLAGAGTDWKPITTLVVGSAATMNTPTEDEAKPQAN